MFVLPRRLRPEGPRTALRVGAAVATCALAVLAAGCDDAKSSSSVDTSASPATSPSTSPAASTPAPDVLTIQGTEWSYAISGSPHAGLVEIDFANVGKASHELGLVRLKDGVTLDQIKAALSQGEAAAHALQAEPGKEITSAGILGPQLSEHVVVPLAAGHYVVTSFLPLDGGSQVDRGMISDFTVLPADGAAEPPATSGVVELTDSSIVVPDGFAEGGTFEVKNTGSKVHDFSVAKVDEALPAFFQCVATSFGKGASIDKCPGTLQGGLTAIPPGESRYVTLVFGQGDYGYVSTQGNGADFQAGLHGTFTKP